MKNKLLSMFLAGFLLGTFGCVKDHSVKENIQLKYAVTISYEIERQEFKIFPDVDANKLDPALLYDAAPVLSKERHFIGVNLDGTSYHVIDVMPTTYMGELVNGKPRVDDGGVSRIVKSNGTVNYFDKAGRVVYNSSCDEVNYLPLIDGIVENRSTDTKEQGFQYAANYKSALPQDYSLTKFSDRLTKYEFTLESDIEGQGKYKIVNFFDNVVNRVIAVEEYDTKGELSLKIQSNFTEAPILGEPPVSEIAEVYSYTTCNNRRKDVSITKYKNFSLKHNL